MHVSLVSAAETERNAAGGSFSRNRGGAPATAKSISRFSTRSWRWRRGTDSSPASPAHGRAHLQANAHLNKFEVQRVKPFEYLGKLGQTITEDRAAQGKGEVKPGRARLRGRKSR